MKSAFDLYHVTGETAWHGTCSLAASQGTDTKYVNAAVLGITKALPDSPIDDYMDVMKTWPTERANRPEGIFNAPELLDGRDTEMFQDFLSSPDPISFDNCVPTLTWDFQDRRNQ